MPLLLTPLQRRVLGVLIEKSLTQPDSYPMTLAAVTTGCNQRSNRDPVMSVTESDVGKAVWELQGKRLVAQADPARGSRVNRFRHDVETTLNWSARDRAIMAELLLRGPQTPGELRTRASRMTPLESVTYVGELLVELSRRDPPMVRELPRGPGQSASRFAHTLYPEDEPLPSVGPTFLAASEAAPLEPDRADALEQRIAALEDAVAALKTEFAALISSRGTA